MRPSNNGIRALLLASALAVAGCSGSDTANDTTAQVTSDSALAVPDTEVVESATTESTSAEALDGSMVELLDSLPLVAYETALDEGALNVEVVLVDLEAGSSVAGLNRPDPSDLDASLDWLMALSTPRSVEDGGTGLALPIVGMPLVDAAARSDEVADELGFSIVDVDRWASISAPPANFATVFGSDLSLSDGLADLGNGIVTAGEGADDELAGSPTALRGLGRPLRLAATDGRVAMSTSTPMVTSWATGDETMIESTNFAAATQSLDTAGVVSAYLAEGLFLPFDSEAAASSFSAPFNLVGIGSAVSDGRATSVIVYVFDDEAAAAAVQPEMDEAWRTGSFEAAGSEPISTFLDVGSVEQQGRVVIIEAAVTDVSTTARVLNVFLRGDPIFSNP